MLQADEPAESWFVVAVESQAESRVARRAEELSITTFYPTGRKYVRSRKRQRVVVMEPRQTPAMPGYVFVKGQHFANFRREFDAPEAIAHCVGWLSGPDGPTPVPAHEIDDLKQRAEAGEFDAVAAQGRYWAPRWLRPTARVKIIAGPLKGLMGEVWRLTASRRVSLWVRMLGELRLAECDVDCVARAR